MKLHYPTTLLHTVSHLRPHQVFYRGWVLLKNYLPHRQQVACTAAGGTVSSAQPAMSTLPIRSSVLDADAISRGHFQFLNVSVDFGRHIQWRDKGKSRLWRYNLHYFDFLHPKDGLPAKAGLRLMRDWIPNNTPGTPDAWDPFPISLRLVNWIKYFCTVAIKECSSEEITRSIYDQSLWLERNLEYHLLANHLFKNAKALVFAGLFFEGSDASRWLSKGIRMLDEQIDEQVLPDGGHFERSPMYHAMILEDCLDLINITHNYRQTEVKNLRRKLGDAAARMISYLVGLNHPDGQIALFNDAAFGIEQTTEDLIQYYQKVTDKEVVHLSDRFWSFPETGYFVMAPKADERMIIDCGPIGPDYQPGHSHCDTLSFELSLNGKRVIVDSGCYQYEDALIRQYNRGNAGHNTLTIDGQNQSEVWGAHRCAKRARPVYAKIEAQEDGSLFFEGAHDGYKRLKGAPIHHRGIQWHNDEINIEDRVEGKGYHDIESRLHFHPDLTAKIAENSVRIKDKEKKCLSISIAGEGKILIEDGWYCPEFGLKYKCPVVVARFKRASLPFKTGWKMKTHN